ncbi:hypothetical protein MBGDF03_00390, partial [Thermoplasmatales archaeon SCGC AB-540-F20]
PLLFIILLFPLLIYVRIYSIYAFLFFELHPRIKTIPNKTMRKPGEMCWKYRIIGMSNYRLDRVKYSHDGIIDAYIAIHFASPIICRVFLG